MNMDVAAALEAELLLLDPLVRNSRAAVEELLADDFVELGRSGRFWSRDELLEAIEGFPSTTDLTTDDLTGRWIANGVVLVRYVTTLDGERTYRSSLWRRTAGRWRIEHHQASALR